ncbi:MAG: DUF6775 family putative metallopeptidase [Nitrosopumilaceae archaeon]
MKVKKIILYDEPSVPEIKLNKIKLFLEEIFPVEVETRQNILHFSVKETAYKIAECKIFNLRKDFEKHTPTNEEVVFEELNIQDTSNIENIVMYDGFKLHKVLTNLILEKENRENIFHVFFTNKLTCTFDCNDFRYHGRALIGANPALISTTGIIEAPAKPKEYYFDLMTNFTQGINVDTIKKKYKGTYLEYHDPRLSKIVEGYLLQAIFYYETGEAFCEEQDCRLFNAHWQKDLLHSQLVKRELCERHQRVLERLIQS